MTRRRTTALTVLALGGVLLAPLAAPASGVTPQPAVVFPKDALPAFGPSAVVSANLLGAEPQTTLERPVPGSLPGAINPDRVFVDWPLSSRAMTGTLHRSLDGGKTFRLLFDPLCAPRSRPNCNSGGGGDTENEVNPITGQVYFGDQEVLVQEAFATSNDHGDTFPIQTSTPITSVATGVDRQWIAAVAPGILDIGPIHIAAFYTYHVPILGEYVVAVTDQGIPLAQPVVQIPNVSQSGQVRVDNTNGPGRGWIYQPFRTNGYSVATAKAADYATPAGWVVSQVGKSATNPDIFPWLSLDDHGNAYATWIHNGRLYYSFSLIDSAKNNPQKGGRPGTEWSAEVEMTPPGLGAVIFPEIVAGTPGRAAISFNGTTEYDTKGTGPTDNAPPNTRWDTYVSVLTNALGKGGPVQVRTGKVSHRPVHTGNICTSGTTCAATLPEKDRSLLDLIDLGVDSKGRVGVVYTDNNNSLALPADPAGPRKAPFVQFAKQVSGTSILSPTPLKGSVPMNTIDDGRGDATWLNKASAPNLASLDLTGASVALEGGDIVAKVKVADLALAKQTADKSTYDATLANVPPADRFQYVIRFSTAADKVVKGNGGEVFHLSAEQAFDADGPLRYFGGKLDANDGVTNPTSQAIVGAGYHTDTAYKVTGSRSGGVLTLRAPAAAFGLKKGSRLLDVAAFSMVGPSEATDLFFTSTSRTVDATAPFDAVLGSKAVSAKPIVSPPKVPPPPSAGGGLPATGGLGAPAAALLLLGVAVVLVRRHRRPV